MDYTIKTKQKHIKAVLPVEHENNVVNYAGTKQLVSLHKVIDKKTGDEIIDCRVFAGKSANSSTLYCDLWVYPKVEKKPKNANWFYTFSFDKSKNQTNTLNGSGTAGGWGYDKKSSCIASAISACGIELYGSPYPNEQKPDFKKRAHIGGTGCHKEALMAIAYACGFNSVYVVSY